MPVTIDPAALTTLVAVKEELDITASTYDDRLKRLINTATSAINRYLGRDLSRADVVDERHPLGGGCRIGVLRTPLIGNLVSVEVEGSASAFDSSSWIVEHPKSGLIYFKTGLPWQGFRRPGIAQDQQPGTEAPSLLITYTGGYITPQQAEISGEFAGQPVTLPAEIETACIDYVSFLWARRGGVAGPIKSETLGDASIEYAVRDDLDSTELPPHVAGAIRAHRRHVIV